MGQRIYSVAFNGEAETVQVDFWEIRAPANKILILHALYVEQSTEAGDAQDEMLTWHIKRSGSAATSGSGGTAAPTARPLDPGDPAFAGTVDTVTNTTKITGGTPVTLHSGNFNVRAGLLYLPTPELRPMWTNQEYLTIELAKTPADSITFSSTMYFQSLG